MNDLDTRAIAIAGGICLLVGARVIIAVFSCLAAKFDYPEELDGEADGVLPRLLGGGAAIRAVWAIYALLPLLLIQGAVGAGMAILGYPGVMTPAMSGR